MSATGGFLKEKLKSPAFIQSKTKGNRDRMYSISIISKLTAEQISGPFMNALRKQKNGFLAMRLTQCAFILLFLPGEQSSGVSLHPFRQRSKRRYKHESYLKSKRHSSWSAKMYVLIAELLHRKGRDQQSMDNSRQRLQNGIRKREIDSIRSDIGDLVTISEPNMKAHQWHEGRCDTPH